jgi:hypothetical protein
MPYHQEPIAITETFRNIPPSSLPGKLGGVRLRHREYIGDLNGGTDFSVFTFGINPGLSALFPWLSYISMVYERYHFHKLAFHLVPNQPTTQSGQSMMAVDYDAADAPPVSKFDLLNMKDACSVGVYRPLTLEAKGRDGLTKTRYVRRGDLAANLDIKTYDVGNLNVGFQGLDSTKVAGSLFVEYDVELITPEFNYSVVASAFSASLTSGASTSKTSIFGSAASRLGGLALEGVGNVLTFLKPGQYLVEMLLGGTGLTDGAPPTISGTAYSVAKTNALVFGSTQATVSYFVNVLEAGQTFIQDWSAVATTVTSTIARIAPYLSTLA